MPIATIIAHSSAFAATSGVQLGSVLAIVCSWQRNRSILWAILAALFSWFYVFYFALTRSRDEVR